jgi:hypothetical protein
MCFCWKKQSRLLGRNQPVFECAQHILGILSRPVRTQSSLHFHFHTSVFADPPNLYRFAQEILRLTEPVDAEYSRYDIPVSAVYSCDFSTNRVYVGSRTVRTSWLSVCCPESSRTWFESCSSCSRLGRNLCRIVGWWSSIAKCSGLHISRFCQLTRLGFLRLHFRQTVLAVFVDDPIYTLHLHTKFVFFNVFDVPEKRLEKRCVGCAKKIMTQKICFGINTIVFN